MIFSLYDEVVTHMKHSVKMQKLSWLQSFFLVLMVHILHLIDSIFTSGPL